MNKVILIVVSLLIAMTVSAQKRFPKFTYTTIQGDTITNTIYYQKSSIVIVGHISCPGMLYLLRDIQKASLDTIQVILLLENTKEQALAFNSNDTNDIWGVQRHAFRIPVLNFPIVTFCRRPRIGKRSNGTIMIKNQCNKLKIKYHALEVPKIYAVNNQGRIIKTHTGWYLNSPDPKRNILNLFQPDK